MKSNEIYEFILKEKGIIPKKKLDFYIDELYGDKNLINKFNQIPQQKWLNWKDKVIKNADYIACSYAIIRETQPNVIIETGTAKGANTCFLLAALSKNNKGKLISIDLPSKENELTQLITVAENKVGENIPDEYKGRWELIVGDAKKYLPTMLLENNVDIFIHDSLHTYTHMQYEYNLAKTLMSEGALILSDDISIWNNSFYDFIKNHELNGFSGFCNPNFGGCINRFSIEELKIGVKVQ